MKKTILLMMLLSIVSANVTLAQTTITVSPSGDTTGVADWNAITQAFEDAKAAGQGSTIQLESGMFYVSKPIVVAGFSGTLKGAGMDATIIEAVRRGPNPGEGFEMAVFPGGFNLPVMFWFASPQGNVNITALTVQCMNPDPVDPWNLTPFISTTGLNNFFDVVDGNFDTSFENVRLRGNSGDFYGSNVHHSIRILGDDFPWEDSGIGNHTFKECYVDHIAVGPHIDLWRDSTITIDKNTCTNIGLDAIRTYYVDNSEILIRENTIKMSHGQIGIRLWYAPSSLVQGNTISSGAWGIVAYNSPFSHITDNQIALGQDGDYASGGVDLYISSNCLIQGNYMTGLSFDTIWLSYSDSTVAQGNQVEDFSSLQPPVFVGSQQCIITENVFTNVDTPYGVIWNEGSKNSILNNNYKQSGIMGWGDPWWTNPGCVMLYFGSQDNLVSESGEFLPGTGGAKNHVLDFGTNNRVVGHPADHVSDPGIGQELQQIKDEIAARQQEKKEMLAELEQEPY